MELGRGKGEGEGRKGLLGLFHPLSHSEGRRGEVHTIHHHQHIFFSPSPLTSLDETVQEHRGWGNDIAFTTQFHQKRFKRTENIFFCFVCSLPTLQEHFLYRLVYCWGISAVFVLHAVRSENTTKTTPFPPPFSFGDRRRKETSIRGIQIRIILAVGGREGKGGGCQQQQQHYRTYQPPLFAFLRVNSFPFHHGCLFFEEKKRKGRKLMSLSRKKGGEIELEGFHTQYGE